MQIPKGTVVAVVDGEKLKMFHNTGDEGNPSLAAVPAASVDSDNHGSGGRHHSSSANPDHGQVEEDGHAAGVAALINADVESGRIKHLVVIAAPRTLGELRKQFSKQVTAVIVGELAKDLTGHSMADVAKAVAAA